MQFDQHQLRDDLQDLADLPSTPVDPTPEIHRRVRRARRRRTAGVAVLAASAVVAVALVAGPTLGGLRSTGTEPGYAGSPHATNDARGTPEGPSFPLPEPWSDREFTKEPDRNAYRPVAYYINQGKVHGRNWGALAFNDDGRSPACIVVEPQEAFDPYVCFNDWTPGQRANWTMVNAYAGPKPTNELLPATLVFGAVSVEARTVDIKVEGKIYHADAVGTPASNRLRFFAIVVPVEDAHPGSVTPRTETGDVAPAPSGLPKHTPCDNCAEATEAPGQPESSDTEATGAGYEEYVPGKQGVGYVVGERAGASAVAYRKNGDGAACLAAEPNATYANTVLCYGDHGQPSGDGVLWKAIPGADGTTMVMGILNDNGSTQVELRDRNGKALATAQARRTPTTQRALFFVAVLKAGVSVEQVKAVD